MENFQDWIICGNFGQLVFHFSTMSVTKIKIQDKKKYLEIDTTSSQSTSKQNFHTQIMLILEKEIGFQDHIWNFIFSKHECLHIY